MKLNKYIFTSIILIILAIILIILSFVFNSKNDNLSNDNSNQSNSNIQDSNVSYDSTYLCTRLLEDNSNFTSYSIEELKVKENIVISDTPRMQIVCKSENIYLSFKYDDNYNKNKTFEDDTMKISFIDGEVIDLTKNDDGNEIKFKLEEYIEFLSKSDYSCVQE